VNDSARLDAVELSSRRYGELRLEIVLTWGIADSVEVL
jgi:hypothetical protein